MNDLSDPAVHRRMRMLVAGGAVTPIGFRRSAEAPSAVEGLRPIDLGQTADGMLVRRMLSVVGALVRLGGMAEHIRHANVILARNLEMLVRAIRAQKRYAPQATVVYECPRHPLHAAVKPPPREAVSPDDRGKGNRGPFCKAAAGSALAYRLVRSLARAAGGAVEVIIRGRVSGATFRDFDAAIADLPYVRFAGPYRASRRAIG